MTMYKKRPQRRQRRSKFGKYSNAVSNVSAGIATGYAVARMAKKAWAGVSAIRKLINVEINNLDLATGLANTDLTSGGASYALSLSAQGDNYGGRTGLSIRPQHISVEAYFNCGTSAGLLRVLLVRSKQDSGTLPTVADILEPTVTINSPYNHFREKEFTILDDKLIKITPIESQFTKYSYESTISGHILYDGTTATQGFCKEGHFYLMFLSTTASGVTSPTGNFYSRIAFTDN